MSQYLLYCVLRKTLCTTSFVSERGDMDSENHSVVIRSIGSHSVKSTVLRPIIWNVYMINAIYNTCMSIVKYKMSLWLMSSWDPFNRHMYYYNNNLIRSAGSRLVDRDWSPNQTRRGALSLIIWFVPVKEMWCGIWDQVTVIMINLIFTLYPSHVMKKLWNKYHGSNVQYLYTKEHLSLLCPPWKRGHIGLQLSVGRSTSFDPFTWSIPNLVQGLRPISR